MYHGARESWNLRDRHMFETLARLLERRAPHGRAVVWAHNSHVGDASATAMGRDGETNLGQLSRRAWGAACVLVGQGTDRGTVVAADDWGEPARVMDVRPVRDDSWEHAFREAGAGRALCDWRSAPTLRQALAQERLERAIGVIYRPQSERVSHYFEAELGTQFDAWLWFERTRALEPLPAPASNEGAADTWPFGV
jgi:erythromycin esterase-like protein